MFTADYSGRRQGRTDKEAPTVAPCSNGPEVRPAFFSEEMKLLTSCALIGIIQSQVRFTYVETLIISRVCGKRRL